MTTVQAWQTVELSGGRGRLTPEPAASLARLDVEFGRPVDVNSAWRSPTVQQGAYEAYLRYLKYGAPWAPIALAPDKSVHCKGEALDSDDASNPAYTERFNRHGWYHTVFRMVNGKWTLVEPWHLEYNKHRDNYFGQPASGGGSVPFPMPGPAPIPEPEPPKEDDMPVLYFTKDNTVYAMDAVTGINRKLTPSEWKIVRQCYAAADRPVPHTTV